MSQPSLDEATHYRVISHLGDGNVVHVTGEQYYKIGLETVYVWDKVAKGWMFTFATPERALSFSGITELRKPVISPVVEASDRLGRTRMIGEIDPSDWRLNASPEVLQPIVSEEHGCTEEEVEEVNDAFSEAQWDAGAVIEEYVNQMYPQQGTDYSREPTHPNDKQVGGDHYKEMSLQPWEVVDQWGTKEQAIGYYLFSAVAYIGRYNSDGEGKGGLKDIQKAKHYLEKLESILLTNED